MSSSAPPAAPPAAPDPLAGFTAATRTWFTAAFPGATRVQREGWPAISAGHDALLIAPTGSGKTLAAFLWCLDRLFARPPQTAPGYRVVYVSPLKALVYDVERNLRVPLHGVRLAAERAGLPLTPIRVDVRTGDTPQDERRRMAREPGDVLVTTPESLYLILGSEARRHLAGVETIIVDEIHALAPTKRGAHLALSLARLTRGAPSRPQRVGLSATVRPPDTVAAFLGDGAPVTVVDASEPPRLDLAIVVPLEDMSRPGLGPAPRVPGPAEGEASGPLLALGPQPLGPRERASVWPTIEPRILELILGHRSTIVFVNSRSLAERLAGRLNELADAPLVRAHHGSLAHDRRSAIEEELKHGELRGIVATSSLELGVDMGAVDLVVQVEAPTSVARGLQRVGRAGHAVGEVSRGRIFPKFRGDLVEAAVVARRMLDGAIEALDVPRNTLDVLAQHIVAMCAERPWRVPELAALVRSTYTFATLSDDALAAVLDMLSGRYPSTDLADLRPRLNWDRAEDVLTARKGARLLATLNAGTIPDRGLYTVHIGPDGPRVGELDEEMVFESRPGDTIVLGASTWRVQEITRDRVLVEPAPGQPGRMPFWKGDGPRRPLETGRAIGAFLRELAAMPPAEAEAWLRAGFPLDAYARKNLIAYVSEQREATGTVPTDRAITAEWFRDELGDWSLCLLSPFGGRVHAPWALALEATLSRDAGFEVQALWSDDGICLRFADVEAPPGLGALALDPEDVEELVVEALGRSALFAATFRESAARALLLPRRSGGRRAPLWQQRLRAQRLLAVVERFPSFPIVLETYRSCLRDVFDLDALRELLGQLRSREVRLEEVVTAAPSPFARSLVRRFVATFMYEGDAPLAERRAQALVLDRALLRELLGEDDLRQLLDPRVLEALEAELQHVAEDHRVRDADGLHDLLRRLGDLTAAEVAERAEGPAEAWLESLQRARRAILLQVGGEPRWVAAEEAGLYRDALGAAPPSGLPAAFLEPAAEPLEQLVTRYARARGPFHEAQVAARYGLPVDVVEAVLLALVRAGRLVEGGFRPGGTGRERCDAEVLRRLRRRTLARLREVIEPVDGPVFARSLLAWQGVGGRRRGPAGVLEVIAQLEGIALSFGELERRILPARVDGYDPRLLDELGAAGQVVWVGRESLGTSDGRVALYRREAVAALAPDPAETEGASPVHQAIVAQLRQRGAMFTAELAARVGAASSGELEAALWDLVWAGQVTNDTFAPLRGLGRPRPKAAPRARPRVGRAVGGLASIAGGRWSLVEDLLLGRPAETERAHALALALLERWGVVGREVAQAESLPGGFAAIYGVLRAMEERGQARRGRFVDGLAGAQFALPGAVDRLRAQREPAGDPRAVLLAATDPASPWGGPLPWPEAPAGSARPRRAAGASVVLVDGVPALFVGGRGRHLSTFPALADPRVAAAAFSALAPLTAAARGRLLTVESIDGEPARGGRWEAALRSAGFAADYRGMILEG